MTITCTINIIWVIKGIDGYGFGKDKCLYNLKTGRKLKQCLNNSCIGYWIAGKFYSIKKLRSLVYKPSKEYCPF
jgi:hypothetical protein